MPGGRPRIKPSINDEAAVQRLCDYLAEGMSVTAATAMPDAPSAKEMYIRCARDEEFGKRIARAREYQQAALIDQTLAMADAATPENWQVVRMQIWARQWHAAKLAPKVYGEKIAHTGGDGGAIATEVTYRWEKPATDES